MKRIVFLFLLVFAVSLVWGATTTVDFETADDGYSASATEGSGYTDVFNRTNPDLGGNSTYIWAVEDITLSNPSIALDQISISGASSFTLSIDMLAHHYNDWDNDDELLITYSIDSGTSQNLMWVQNIGATYNQTAALDTDFDGDGECVYVLPSLTTGTSGCTSSSSIFETFTTSAISLSSNSTLDITLQFNGLTSTDEGIYLDNIEIETVVGGSPILTLSESSLTGFSYVEGSGPSSEQSFTAEGSDLTADISITPPTNYEISTGTGGSFSATNPITLTQTGGSVSSTSIYVRLKSGLSTGAFDSEDISASSSGATTRTVSCDGDVHKPEPTNHATAFSVDIGLPTYSSIAVEWVDAIEGTIPDAYLIKGSSTNYAAIADPVNGVYESDGGLILNIAAGSESASFSSLSAETTYYFKLFPYTNSDTDVAYKTDGTVPSDNATTSEAPATLNAGDLIITEFAGAGINGDWEDEFIELYNNTDSSIDLSTCHVKYYESSQEGSTLDLAGTLASGAYFVIAARTSGNWIELTPTNDITGSWHFNNPGYVELVSVSTIIDRGGSSASKFASDKNYERIDFLSDGSDVSNDWLQVASTTTSAGAANTSDDPVAQVIPQNTDVDFGSNNSTDPAVTLNPESGTAMGSTTVDVVRGQEHPNAPSGKAIERYVEIVPSSQPSDATFTFYYKDSELNGLTEANLWLYGYWDGSWHKATSCTRNTTDNWVQATGIDHFSGWTLGDADDPLPVTLSTFSAQYISGNAILNWSTQSEDANMGWNIYRSITVNMGQSIVINAEGMIEGAGTTSEPTDYIYEDEHEIEFNTVYWYWIESISNAGEVELFGPVTLTTPYGDPNSNSTPVPIEYGLYQNYPNPFNPSTEISFMLAENSLVELSIYDIKGRKVTTLLNDQLVSADQLQSIVWNGVDDGGKKVSSGLYFYKLDTGSKIEAKRMLLVK
jgi:Lamin Tail Domain